MTGRLFLLEGVVTVAFAGACVFILPNTFESCPWLTETERSHLVHSLEVDRGQKDKAGDVGVGKALLMACADPKTWLACGLLFFTYVAAAVTNFFPSVVKTLGFDRTITYCLSVCACRRMRRCHPISKLTFPPLSQHRPALPDLRRLHYDQRRLVGQARQPVRPRRLPPPHHHGPSDSFSADRNVRLTLASVVSTACQHRRRLDAQHGRSLR
jgi:hypothetical protein